MPRLAMAGRSGIMARAAEVSVNGASVALVDRLCAEGESLDGPHAIIEPRPGILLYSGYNKRRALTAVACAPDFRIPRQVYATTTDERIRHRFAVHFINILFVLKHHYLMITQMYFGPLCETYLKHY